MLNKNKAIFYDRDGIINVANVIKGKPFPPRFLKDLKLTNDIEEILLKSKELGYLNIIVTNQPDYKRGFCKKHDITEIHDYLLNNLLIDDIYVCWDEIDDISEMRKPKPGMIFAAAEKHNIELKKSFMVGDRWKDIDAGYLAGCKTLFVDYSYDENLNYVPDFIVSEVYSILDYIR